MLLLEPNRVVPVTRLVDAVWEDAPPATASHQVRKAVAELRRRIPDGSSVITTQGSGYRSVIPPDRLDLALFLSGVQDAHLALESGDTSSATRTLTFVLDLWRGPVMLDGGGPVIAAASAHLEERRLSAMEQLIELRLQNGEAGELTGDLRDLIAGNPLRETLRRLLMLALYRSGRQAEALEEYGRVRHLLAEELGIGPSSQLTTLYEQMLRESPELAAPAAVPPGDRPTARGLVTDAPCTLPYDLVDFTGRERELRRLMAYATAPQPGARIVAIDGMGGCGKTSLAVRAAHRLAGRYPDGQLHVDLRGFTPGEEPERPAAVLESLLHTLGFPRERLMPGDVQGLSALWRATLAGRRILLLLDDAASSEQVLPLLPSSPSCLVLITGRMRLVGLDGAEWISLGTMSDKESTELLAGTLGKDRIAAEPEATATLAELCGHLPLAIRLATSRLRNRPRWNIGYLVERLVDETHRLDELSLGNRSIEASLNLSYLAMAPSKRFALRMLGLHPATTFDAHSAAALLGTSVQEAEKTLEYLLDVHLLQQHEIRLYTFHDLVRDFVHGLRPRDSSPENTELERAAVDRTLRYYVLAARKACDVLFPGRSRINRELPPGPSIEIPQLQNSDRALAWLDRERGALLGAVALSERYGFHAHTAHLTRDVVFHLNLRGYFREFRELCGTGVAAARRLEDPQLLRISLGNLAVAHWKLGRFREGITTATEGLEIARATGESSGEGFCLDLLGLLHSALGDLPEAFRYLRQGVALHRTIGYERQEAESLGNLSSLHSWTGNYREALNTAGQAMRLNQRLGIQDNQVSALSDMAIAHLGLNDVWQALSCLEEALDLADETHTPENVALVLALRAESRQRLGDHEAAHRDTERALRLARSKGTPLRQSAVENLLGLVHRRRKRFSAAFELHEHAYRRATAIGYRIEIARAAFGLAEACESLGRREEAARYHERAEELFTGMGIPRTCRPNT
ncbi:BTAD domain-containing putative transcriptional regulator [Nocardiopsis sp. NPDC049922]|uniref:AfsR/SARP family transcriptional regulator n=1 Tax=Nocardiopsis sp. NPDC049922 TaxID=3155157 RepID=UPI0033F1C510